MPYSSRPPRDHLASPYTGTPLYGDSTVETADATGRGVVVGDNVFAYAFWGVSYPALLQVNFTIVLKCSNAYVRCQELRAN